MTKKITGLSSSRPLTISLVAGLITWLISLIPTIILKNRDSNSVTEVTWFYLAFSLVVLVGMTIIIATGNLYNYRVLVLSFCSISFAFCILAVQGFTANVEAVSVLATIGFLLYTFVLFFWLLAVGQLTTKLENVPDSAIVIDQEVTQTKASYQNTFDTNPFATRQRLSQFLSSGDESEPISVNQNSSSNGTVYKLKARALYSYQANSEDSSELSFNKGDILEVGDTSGKWWAARDTNGRTGIVPSNYLQLI